MSRQKDPSRVVGPGAYLLFYRRRSEIPLGGPRFQDIINRYNAQRFLDDDSMLESGEGQRLGQGSSLRGSPSALTGADRILHRGSLGLASDHGDRAVDTELPSYQASLGQAGEADDDTEVRWDQGALRNSIEADGEDEAIHLPDFGNAGPSMQLNAVLEGGWTFDSLPKGGPDGGLDDDIASDVAQGDNSSVNDDPFASDSCEMEPILQNSGFIDRGGAEDDFSAFNDPPASIPLNGQVMEPWDQTVHTVPANIGDDEVNEQVTEIHVSDDTEQPLSQPQRTSSDA